jgi:hypothetical protein
VAATICAAGYYCNLYLLTHSHLEFGRKVPITGSDRFGRRWLRDNIVLPPVRQLRERDMTAILPFLRARSGVFDPKDLQVLGEAFDAASAVLTGLTHPQREAIADRIIDLAMNGERDPIRLRDAGIAAAKQ